MSDGQQTPKKQYELQMPVEVGAHLSHVPSNTNAHGDEINVGTVLGSVQGEVKVTFDISEQGSSVRAPLVIGEAANGWVNGDDITLSCLGKTGQAHSTRTLDIKVVIGMATAEKDATVGVIHCGGHVNSLGKLKVTEGIYGSAEADSINTPFIDGNARVNSRHGLLFCDQIDGVAKGLRIVAGTISHGASAKALEQVTVDRLEGLAEAPRVVIKDTIIGTRFVNERGMDLIRNLDPDAPHNVYNDVCGQALAKAINIKGVMGDISIGRLADIYRERLVWNDEMCEPYGNTARKTHDIFVKVSVHDGQTVYPCDFFSSSFEVRDLATGKINSIFTIEGKKIEDALLNLTAVVGESITIEC